METNFVVALPDGTFLDLEGEYCAFFFAKLFDSFELAMEFALSSLDYGISFRIDTIYTKK